MKKYIKGFTLIELLVVIAIIGILASVVLVSLNSARQKGKDARVISDVQQIRTALESGYNSAAYPDINGANTSCNTAANSNVQATFANCQLTGGPQNSVLTQLNSDANSQGGTIYISTTGGASATGYAIRGKLTASASYFCIDSTGATNQSDDGTNATVARCH